MSATPSKNVAGYATILVSKMQAEMCWAKHDDWMKALTLVVGNQRIRAHRVYIERALAHEDEIIAKMQEHGRLMP